MFATLFVSVRDARTWRAALAGRAIDHVWGVHAGPLPASFHEAVGSVPATLLLDDGRVDPKLGAAPACASGRLVAAIGRRWSCSPRAAPGSR